jgi:hypothetical protein
MAANNRIYYATQAVLLNPMNSDGSSAYTNWYRPQGVQSVGITTNFSLEQIFQLGQLDVYDQVEDVPDVEVTLNKIIDGTLPLYLMCVGGSSGYAGGNNADLSAIANNRVNVRLGIFNDTASAASGASRQHVDCTGMYLSSVSYTFPLVGNSKVWNADLGAANDWLVAAIDQAPGYSYGNASAADISPATARRYKVDPGSSDLPLGQGGLPVPLSGTRTYPYLQNITLSTDLGREQINELGAMTPYYRYVTFPVEVTSEFEIIASDGDQVDADDFASVTGCDATYQNLVNKSIKIVVCGTGAGDTLAVDLGDKNKLSSINYTGGDTGGGNATITYSFQTFNAFKVAVSGSNGFAFANTNDVGSRRANMITK